ncbi:hypothetical protein FACS189472_16480 [Alphaproteobacteria bacterium]|nr:hypothetical protein FACS189472_16480 [Alphaproteobacteria bacterium]
MYRGVPDFVFVFSKTHERANLYNMNTYKKKNQTNPKSEIFNINFAEEIKKNYKK